MIAFALVGVWTSQWLGYIWTESLVFGTTFKDYYGVNLLAVALWIPSLVVFVIFGAAFAASAKITRKYYWPLGLGIIASAYWFSLTEIVFAKEPSLIDLAWSYSGVFVPIPGSVLGSWMYRRAMESLNPEGESNR